MKTILLVLAFISAALGAAYGATPDRRVALVVGNARYADAPLKNPANDARAMASSLRDRGFDVILRVDATKQQMEAAIIEFGEKLTEGATGLFFFAGHGMQVQGRNYVIPTDAKLTTEQRIKLETIDIDAVLDQMQGARSKVNVVILDACRNNPFERRFRSASGGLAQINAPEGTLIAYATAPGRVAADGEGDNGLYTSELLNALRTPGLKVEDVFKQVRINVARASNGAQTPWEASSLVGDFYFVAPTPVAAPAPSNAAELAFWNTIRTASDPGEYRAYLSQYPKGEFVALAQMRLAALDKAQAEARLVAAEKARADAAERAQFEAAERARLEIERIRREMAERSQQEIERARADAAERARAEIERARLAAARPAASTTPVTAPVVDKPVQQAALPSPSVSLTSARFDGLYNAKFTMISTLGFMTYDAAIEVSGSQILGKAASSGSAPESCTLTGTFDAGTGAISSMFMPCRWNNVHFKGRFALNPETGKSEARTEASSINDGRNVPVVWLGPTPSDVTLARTQSVTDGRYEGVVAGATWNNKDLPATLEIRGQQITGMTFNSGAPCPFTGQLQADGVAKVRIACDRVAMGSNVEAHAITVDLEGRFGLTGDKQEIIGDTSFRSSDQRSGKVVWRKLSQ